MTLGPNAAETMISATTIVRGMVKRGIARELTLQRRAPKSFTWTYNGLPRSYQRTERSPDSGEGRSPWVVTAFASSSRQGCRGLRRLRFSSFSVLPAFFGCSLSTAFPSLGANFSRKAVISCCLTLMKWSRARAAALVLSSSENS